MTVPYKQVSNIIVLSFQHLSDEVPSKALYFMKRKSLHFLPIHVLDCLSEQSLNRPLLHTDQVFLLPSGSVLCGNGWQCLYKQHCRVMHHRLLNFFFFLFCPALTCAQNISLQLPGLFYTPGFLIKVTFAFPSLIWFNQTKFSWKCINAFCFYCSGKCTEKKLFNAVWPPLGIPHM